jgi:hypothetical protein
MARSLVRRVGRRVPGAWTVYKGLRYVVWEVRAAYHGLRTGPLARFGSGGSIEQRPSAAAPPVPGAADRDTTVPIGEAAGLARVGNLLAAEGAGPPLHDWRPRPDGTTTFVLGADAPPGAEARETALLSKGRLRRRAQAAPGGLALERYEIADPRAEADRLLNPDTRKRLHFGREYKLRGGRYLYQSIPLLGQSGRRDTARRWQRIESALGRAGVSVKDRLVLDVGCNAGMMLASALAGGAAFGLGWDMPEVAQLGDRVLHALGFTRFELFGADLGEAYRLGDDVPAHVAPLLSGSVVLYLAIRHHVGFVGDLADLPWKAMVYEGGEEETAAGLEETLAPLRARTEFRLVEAVDYRDGEGRPRPLAILVRD